MTKTFNLIAIIDIFSDENVYNLKSKEKKVVVTNQTSIRQI